MSDRIAEWLTEKGVAFSKVETLLIAEIDIKESLKNQARLASGAINKDQMEVYHTALTNGDLFPPIVVMKRADKYIIIDGNNRIAAAKQAEFEAWPFGAYVVEDPTAAQLRSLLISANKTHGLPTSIDDRIEHAVFLVEEYGQSKTIAAQTVGVSISKLKRYFERREVADRAKRLGIRKLHTISATSIEVLGRIRLDDIFAKAVELTIAHNLTSDEAKKFQKIIRNLHTREEQMNAIEYEDQRLKAEKREVSDLNVMARKRLAKIKDVTTRCKALSASDIQSLPGEMQESARNNIEVACKHLGHLYKAIQ